MPPSIPLQTVADETNRQARQRARQSVSWPLNLAPESVDFDSQGHLLLIGSELDVRRAARRLSDRLDSLTLLVVTASDAAADEDLDALFQDTETLPCFTAPRGTRPRLEGYLGRFSLMLDLADRGPASLARAAQGREHFDLVLDLAPTPCLDLELPPPGYHAARWGSADCERLLDELPTYRGAFQAPRPLRLDSDRCAHHRHGKPGCDRCLEACPADAITRRQGRVSAWIEVDPHRCHGSGGCTSVCPTGALGYHQPTAEALETHIQALLAGYRDAGGQHPVVRFIDRQRQAAERDEPAGHVLDMPLEELGAAGLDSWLAALAAGAAEVRLQDSPALTPGQRRLLESQLTQARELVAALGHAPERLGWCHDSSDRDALPRALALEAPAAPWPAEPDKRSRLNRALGRLAELGRPSGHRHALPGDAPFGGLHLDGEACTLCQGCVSACPTPALAGGDDDTPRLSFREADCIQCGLCQASCPEDAIRLAPGFLASGERERRRVLKEEPAFACIRCGTPFATASTIASIKRKLAAHPYFAGEAARRLEMCEDCRVRDVWRSLAADPESQLKV